MPPAVAPASVLLCQYDCHNGAVTGMIIHKESMMTCSLDKTVCIYNLAKNEITRRIGDFPCALHCLCGNLVDDCKSIFVGSGDGLIYRVDTQSGAIMGTWKGHKDAVLTIKASPDDGDKVYSGSKDGNIRVWSIKEGKCVQKYVVHSGPVSCLNLSNGYMVSGSWDGTLYTFDLATRRGKRIALDKDEGNGGGVRTVLQISRLMAGKTEAYPASIFAGYGDGKGRRFLAKTEQLGVTMLKHTASLNCCVADETNGRLYTGSEDCSIQIWNIKGDRTKTLDGVPMMTFEGHKDGILCMVLQGSLLYTAGYDRTIRLWDTLAIDRTLDKDKQEYSLPPHLSALTLKRETVRKNSFLSGGGFPFDNSTCLFPALGLRLQQEALMPTVAETLMRLPGSSVDIRPGDRIMRYESVEIGHVQALWFSYAMTSSLPSINLTLQRGPLLDPESVVVNIPIAKSSTFLRADYTALVGPELVFCLPDIFHENSSINDEIKDILATISKFVILDDVVRSLRRNSRQGGILLRDLWNFAEFTSMKSPRCTLAAIDYFFWFGLDGDSGVNPEKCPHHPDSEITPQQFLLGLIRFCSRKYKKTPSSAKKFEKFFGKHVQPNAAMITHDHNIDKIPIVMPIYNKIFWGKDCALIQMFDYCCSRHINTQHVMTVADWDTLVVDLKFDERELLEPATLQAAIRACLCGVEHTITAKGTSIPLPAGIKPTAQVNYHSFIEAFLQLSMVKAKENNPDNPLAGFPEFVDRAFFCWKNSMVKSPTGSAAASRSLI